MKEVIRLRVKDLEYYPRRKFVAESLSLIRRKISDYKLEWILPGNLKYLKEIPEASLLNIAFDALSGQITAILGTESERKSLIHLLAGRKKSGKYDGDASLCGDYYNQDYYYYENVAFVPEVR